MADSIAGHGSMYSGFSASTCLLDGGGNKISVSPQLKGLIKIVLIIIIDVK